MIKKNFLTFICMVMTCTQLCAQTLDGAWKGDLKAGAMTLPLVINIKDGKCTVDSPDQGAFGIEANTNHISTDSLNISIPAIGGTYAGRLHGNTMQGEFCQMGMRFPLNLEKTIIERKRPQTPQPPFGYATEEVTFDNTKGGATLAGTLTYPAGYDGKSKIPVMIMITGSGQQNRDEEVFGHKPFLVIADHMALHGIATLRYDDRATGKSTGDATTFTTGDAMEDAAAGIEYLRSTGKFSKIGALGHSEGGTVAFMLAARGKADFIVSMAGCAVRGDSLLLKQTQAISGIQTITLEQVRTMAKAQNNAWTNYFIDFSPKSDIARTKCPVMAINGDKDLQVDADMNLESIRHNLPAGNNANIKKYAGLNHLFQHCTTGKVGEYAEIEETISQEVLDDISKWIVK